MVIDPSNVMWVKLLISVYAIVLLTTKSGHTLDYRQAIDSYVMRTRDLHLYELSDEDWTSIALVSSWLKSFRSATTQMSATMTPMLLTTLAIFYGLQDDIKTILHGLTTAVPHSIKMGLINAHRKLSEYYFKYNESPFYTWAVCKSQHQITYTFISW